MSNNEFILDVSLEVRPFSKVNAIGTAEGIKIRHNVKLGRMSFSEIGATVARFDELADIIKREREDVTG